MSNLSFENQGTNTYLIYKINEEDTIDSMSLGMLTNNVIPGLVSASLTQMDLDRYIKYNISSKVPAKQLFSGVVNKKRLIGVFSGIIDAILSAEDYMLDINSLLFDLEYIFVDVSSCETVVVCLPIMNGEYESPDLVKFFKNIIFNTQFDQTENCDYVAQILNYLNSNPILSSSDFKDLLVKIGSVNQPAQVAQPKPTPVATVHMPPAASNVQQPTVPVNTNMNAPKNQVPVKVAPKQVNPHMNPNYIPTNQQPIPMQTSGNGVPVAPQPQAQNAKKMSMFYLLQHYNKENAAIYKAQKQAKKAQKNAVPPTPQPIPQAMPQQMPQTATGKQPNVGFAVPGKPGTSPAPVPVPNQQRPMQPQGQIPMPARAKAMPQQPVQPQVPGQKYQQPVQPKMPMPNQQQPVQPQVPPTGYQQPVQAGKPINFGETIVLNSGIGETTVLGTSAEPVKMNPHLIRAKNNEKILLNKPVFRIGKERSYVDYFIGDNSAISRSHANIISRDGEFLVVDTNSTNHTYVNGQMIQSNFETKIVHGTKIKFANEDFEFRLY